MSSVTINGNTYSADGSTPKDMLNGGHRTHFIPLCADVATVAGQVQVNADQVAIDAVNATDGANAVRGTSTTSLTVGAGVQVLTTQAGKQFAGGNYVTISRTSAPTTLMHGVVTDYTGTTLTVDIATVAGGGTFDDWTIALSGAKGNNGPSGAGDLVRVAKTSAYTVLSTDKGKLIDCSGTFTLSFSACATLGADWATYIKNSGTGPITLDPNGAELINGAATYTLARGSAVLVQCDGTEIRTLLVVDNKLLFLPIFSTEAVTATPMSALEFLENGTHATGLPGNVSSLCRATGQFIATCTGSGDVATSPYGQTWTLRSMPSSANWYVITDGSANCVACVPNSTTTAKSTNAGVSWTSGTALPGTARNSATTLACPNAYGGIFLAVASAASTIYRSTDVAGAWSTETTPAAINGLQGIYAVGGLFWYYSSGTTAYTSATGLTGSWTARTLPITPGGQYIMADFDGAILMATGAGGSVYRTTDGINWPMIGEENFVGGIVNGVLVRASNQDTYSNHAKRAFRSSLANIRLGINPYRAKSGSLHIAFAGTAGVARIDPSAADAAVGMFTF